MPASRPLTSTSSPRDQVRTTPTGLRTSAPFSTASTIVALVVLAHGRRRHRQRVALLLHDDGAGGEQAAAQRLVAVE
mgnify:CR=1 FL=1